MLIPQKIVAITAAATISATGNSFHFASYINKIVKIIKFIRNNANFTPSIASSRNKLCCHGHKRKLSININESPTSANISA